MYRPQYPYSLSSDFQDRDFVYYFDQTNTPQLQNALNLSVGGIIMGIPLQLESDAPFTWRGIKVLNAPNYALRFRDTSGNYLSEDWVQVGLAFQPDAAPPYGCEVIDIEPAVPCPQGSVILVDVMRVA